MESSQSRMKEKFGPTLIAYEAIEVFIVPQILWHGASVSAASSEGPPCSVTLYDKGYCSGPIDMYFNPAPFVSLIPMVLTKQSFSFPSAGELWDLIKFCLKLCSLKICRILTMGTCNKWHASVGPFRDNVQISQGFKFLRRDICQVRIYIAILTFVWRKHLYMRLSFGSYRKNDRRLCHRRCGQIKTPTPLPFLCKVVSAEEKAKCCNALPLQVAYHHFETLNLEESHKITSSIWFLSWNMLNCDIN